MSAFALILVPALTDHLTDSLFTYFLNTTGACNSWQLCSTVLMNTELADAQPLHQRWQWHPTPVLSPGGLQSMGSRRSDMTERLHFHFSLSCIGEGNGNPLQGSCLENPRDSGAWWAAVCGVTQSQTRLKRLSSSRTNLPKENTGLGPYEPLVTFSSLDPIHNLV